MAIKLTIQEDRPKLKVGQGSAIPLRASSGYPVYENNYDNLRNKPSINGVELSGNKTTEDLHIEVSGGVTSWNGQTGDVTYTPPNYALTYDESVSVGSAVVGEAVTGEPNYTPSGAISIPTLNWEFKNKKLYFYGVTAPTFTGNGVTFAIEQEN